MPKPLFATFPSSDAFSQHFSGEIATKFLAVLEVVSDCLCHAADTNWNAINSSFLAPPDIRAWSENRTKCNRRPRVTGFFASKVDCHPNRGSVNWETLARHIAVRDLAISLSE
jgi:hypothetical protein